MSGHLTIVSCGLGPQQMTDEHKAVVAGADVLVGGIRLLEWFPEFGGEKIEVGAHALETVQRTSELAASRKVAVLASGDALFFGIARLFLKCLPGESITILPNVTAAQSAFARLQMPWEGARFFTVHGRDIVLPWRRVLRSQCAVIYCDGKRNPGEVAAELMGRFEGCRDREAAVVADLGGDETVWQGGLSDVQAQGVGGMSILIVMQDDTEGHSGTPTLALGLGDEEYEHERNLITHAEVRAVVLAKLRLRPGLMWDLGAGSGSVAVEAVGLCEGLSVCAVEEKAERCEQIRQNAEAAGCAEFDVINGDILKVMPELPVPQAIFIGGGGVAIAEIAEGAYGALSAGGVMVVSAVLEDTRAAMLDVLDDVEREVIEIAVRRSSPLGKGSMMKPDNPITLLVFRKDTV